MKLFSLSLSPSRRSLNRDVTKMWNGTENEPENRLSFHVPDTVYLIVLSSTDQHHRAIVK